MKKFLMIILCASIIVPSFAFADEKSERNNENDSRKSENIVEKYEKKENKAEMKVQKEMKHVVVRLEAAITRVLRLSDRVSERLTKLEVRGVNTTSSRAHLLEAKIKLDEARAKVAVIKLLIETTSTATSTTASTTAKSKMKGIKIAVKDAKETIKEAHSHVALAISEAKPGDNDGSHSTTTPDTVAPVISAVVTSGVASTTAAVSWNTNELATGKLYFGTSTPLTTFVYNPTLSLTRTQSLTGLIASTTYRLLLESKDAQGNTATTTSSFVTTN